jgi:hypothetical protein
MEGTERTESGHNVSCQRATELTSPTRICCCHRACANGSRKSIWCTSDQLDLSAIHAVYEQEKRGQPPYDPRLMTKLLVYGYCTGVFSSRRMQKRLQEDIPFKVLAAAAARAVALPSCVTVNGRPRREEA